MIIVTSGLRCECRIPEKMLWLRSRYRQRVFVFNAAVARVLRTTFDRGTGEGEVKEWRESGASRCEQRASRIERCDRQGRCGYDQWGPGRGLYDRADL